MEHSIELDALPPATHPWACCHCHTRNVCAYCDGCGKARWEQLGFDEATMIHLWKVACGLA